MEKNTYLSHKSSIRNKKTPPSKGKFHPAGVNRTRRNLTSHRSFCQAREHRRKKVSSSIRHTLGSRMIAFTTSMASGNGGLLNTFLFISVKNKKELIRTDEIMIVKGSGQYSDIFLQDGRTITYATNIGTIERQLTDEQFIRVHRSYLINILHVKLQDGQSLEVGDKFVPIGKTFRDVLDGIRHLHT
ncbi:MAG: LytTR family DNA-binding domain-containing protein [Bacteroidota bacterium]